MTWGCPHFRNPPCVFLQAMRNISKYHHNRPSVSNCYIGEPHRRSLKTTIELALVQADQCNIFSAQLIGRSKGSLWSRSPHSQIYGCQPLSTDVKWCRFSDEEAWLSRCHVGGFKGFKAQVLIRHIETYRNLWKNLAAGKFVAVEHGHFGRWFTHSYAHVRSCVGLPEG